MSRRTRAREQARARHSWVASDTPGARYRRGPATVRVLAVAISVLLLVAACAPRTGDDIAEGVLDRLPDPWPRFSAAVPSVARGTKWTETSDGLLSSILVGEWRTVGITHRTLNLVTVAPSTGISEPHELYRGDEGMVIRSAQVLPVADGFLVGLSLISLDAGYRGLSFFSVGANGRIEDLTTPEFSIPLGGFSSESDWQLFELDGRPWVVYSRADGSGSRIVVDAVTDGQDGWTVWRSDRRAGAIAVVPWHNRLVAAWREVGDDDTAFVVVAQTDEATDQVGGIVSPGEWTALAEVRAGYDLRMPVNQVSADTFLGVGVTQADRESMAISVGDGVVTIAYSEITRQRSRLSEYQSRPVALTVDLSTGDRLVEALTEEAPGIVDSAFQTVVTSDGVIVSFLREVPGDVQSAVYVTDSRDGRPYNVTQTPRRVGSPHLILQPTGVSLVWIQEDPIAAERARFHTEGDRGRATAGPVSLWQVALATSDQGIAERISPAPWRGRVAEAVAVVAVALPLSAILAIYWTVIGNIITLAVVSCLVVAIHRFAPVLPRRRPLLVSAAAAILPLLLVGVEPLKLAGPSPPLLVRGIVAVIVCIVVFVRHQIDRRAGVLTSKPPTPAEPLAIALISALLAIGAVSYHQTLSLLADPGSMPIIL